MRLFMSSWGYIVFVESKKKKKKIIIQVSANFLTTLHSWVRRQWCSLLASFSWLKCTVVAVLVRNTIERRADGRDSVKRMVCGCLIRTEWGGRCVQHDKGRQVKWKVVGESLDFSTLTSIISFKYEGPFYPVYPVTPEWACDCLNS